MPKVDFTFSGWVRGVNVNKVTNVEGDEVNVESMTSEELANKLNEGEFFVSLAESLNVGKDEEIELFDFEESA